MLLAWLPQAFPLTPSLELGPGASTNPVKCSARLAHASVSRNRRDDRRNKDSAGVALKVADNTGAKEILTIRVRWFLASLRRHRRHHCRNRQRCNQRYRKRRVTLSRQSSSAPRRKPVHARRLYIKPDELAVILKNTDGDPRGTVSSAPWVVSFLTRSS